MDGALTFVFAEMPPMTEDAFRKAVSAFGGAVAGRSCAKFAQPRNALSAAAALGRAGAPRVGVDTGATERARSLCAAASGGEILVSDAVRHLAAGEFPHSVALRDLGRRRLDDGRRERIHQLLAEGLPSRPARRGLLSFLVRR